MCRWINCLAVNRHNRHSSVLANARHSSQESCLHRNHGAYYCLFLYIMSLAKLSSASGYSHLMQMDGFAGKSADPFRCRADTNKVGALERWSDLDLGASISQLQILTVISLLRANPCQTSLMREKMEEWEVYFNLCGDVSAANLGLQRLQWCHSRLSQRPYGYSSRMFIDSSIGATGILCRFCDCTNIGCTTCFQLGGESFKPFSVLKLATEVFIHC